MHALGGQEVLAFERFFTGGARSVRDREARHARSRSAGPCSEGRSRGESFLFPGTAGIIRRLAGGILGQAKVGGYAPSSGSAPRFPPGAPRGGRDRHGYPVAPAIFVAAMFAIVVNAVYQRPEQTGLGLLVMAAGIPLYLFLTRRRRPT